MNKTSAILFWCFLIFGLTFASLGVKESINTYQKQCTAPVSATSPRTTEPDECSYSAVAFKCLIPVTAGLLFALIGGIPLLREAIKQYNHKKLIKTGTPITTQFKCIRVKKRMLVNKRTETASVIVSTDSTKIWEFESPFIWTDQYAPAIVIQTDQSITVYVDPLDYTKYAMDISHLL